MQVKVWGREKDMRSGEEKARGLTDLRVGRVEGDNREPRGLAT